MYFAVISFLFLLTKISKNGIVSSFSSANVNWIFISKLFKTEIINSVVPIFTKQIVSSTYRFQNVIYLVNFGKSEFSSSIKQKIQKIFNRNNVKLYVQHMQNKTQQQRCLFSVCNLDIIWLSMTAPEFI